MYLKLSFLCLLTTPFLGYAQIRLTGRITDNKNHPIEFANVFLSDSKGKLITGTTTDSKGHFRLSAKKGTYILRVSFVGFSDYKKKIILDKDKNLGAIILKEAADKLKGVVVTAEKKLIGQKVDRLVFNVENSIAASGGDALDALKVTPRVRVQNDQISMIGKGSMRVMVNDRIIPLTGEDLVNYLRSISSDDIKSIEVITNPPAKYSAEGNSGLINIKLKKGRKNSWSASLYSSYKQTTYPIVSIGESFSLEKKRTSIYANVNYSNGSHRGTGEETTLYPKQRWENNSTSKISNNNLGVRTGIDYKIHKNWKLGIGYVGGFSKPKTNQFNNNTIYDNASRKIDSLVQTDSQNRNIVNINAINLNSNVKLDTLGGKLTADIDYFTYENTSDRNFTSQNYLSNNTAIPNSHSAVKNDGVLSINIYSFKVDVVKSLSWVNLSFGTKVYFSKTRSDDNYFDVTTGRLILNSNRSNKFDYTENVQAFYLSGQRKIDEHWNVKLGLRLENTQTEGNSLTLNRADKNNYIKYFPTVYISYKPNDDDSFSFKYARRFSRPGFKELNPFRIYYNPYNYSEGNPFLKPTLNNVIALGHIYKGNLNTSLYYAHSSQGRGNPPFFDQNTGITYLKDINYYNSDEYGLDVYYFFNRLHWLESSLEGNIGYRETHIEEASLHMADTKGLTAYFSIDNQIVLNTAKTLRGEVNFWYQPSIFSDIYKIDATKSLDIGLSYSFWEKRLKASLYAQNILKSDIDGGDTKSANTYYQYSDYYDSRYFRFSVTYNFGNHEIKVRERKFGNEKERRRAGN